MSSIRCFLRALSAAPAFSSSLNGFSAILCVIGFSSLLLSTAQAQAPSGDPEVFSVHDKLASSEQGADLNFGSAVAMDGDVLIAADDNEHVEVFRKAGDGSWSLEAVISAPSSGTEFGAREALATNGDWIAIGAKLDDTYQNNAGAVHMYKYDGLDWQYNGSLSHMAPFGSIVTDWFGMAVAMDGNRMVVGSRAENGVGAAGAVHYFEYNAMLDMWLESGFIASQHTEGNSTSKFAESVDISGDYMIVGEHRNNTNGQFAGAAHIYAFYNQCWHHQNVFYGHNAQDILGKDVAISGTTAVAGSPFADTDDLNEAGAVTLYRLLPFSGGDSAWAETAHFAPDGTSQGDWVGSAVDIDGSLLAVGVPRDDEFIINGGAGYFLFDCTDGALTCVNEGFACDAMQNDRLGFDVAVSEGLAAIGATLDDNIYENAGSVYILGMDDLGFECDLTAPGMTETDLLTSDDTGVNAYDDTTRQTTPDFDVILPGGGGLSVTADYLAEAGDAVVFYMEGTGDSSIVILTQEDIDNGAVNMDFVYPGPVLEDGEYTFCSYLIDVFGNVGPTDCTTILIDNDDPEPALDFGASAVAGSDTTLYLDANGGIDLDVQGQANISASDNIAMDTIYVDITEFDCSDAGNIVTVTLTAVDLAGNQATTTFDVAIEDEVAPIAIAQDITVQLNGVGSATITPEQIDNGSNDACGIATLSLDKTTFDCTEVGPNTVTLTVTDNNGNTATATATVTVEDNVAPSAVAQDLTVQLDATGAVSITPEQLNNGSSNACGIESMTLDISSFTCADVGPNTVTLTVTDSNGNVSTATATVTVEDNVLPAMVTQDITVQLDASGAVSITAAQIDNGSSDACGIDTLYLDVYDFDCDDQGANTVTLTAVDVNGNLNTATATVTVQDLADPTASAQDITIELDATGNASITPDQVDNGSDDACGGIASMTVSPDSFDCEDLGANTVTLTVFDGSGNSATATATVTVVDEVAPDVTGTFPADIILYADDDNGSIDVTPLGAAGAASVDYSDNCSGEGNKTYGVAGQVPTGGLIITAIGDPNDDWQTCRFVEIHNSSDADINLTGYALQRWTNDNAGPSTGSNIDLSAIGTMAPGTYAHIANNAGFEGCYGFAPSIIAGSGGPADSNGDDNIAIIDGSSNIIDMFGVAGEDGSNTCHEFEDGIALRAGSNTDPNGGAWDESGWIVYSDGSSASGCTNHNSGQPQNASDIALLINNWAGAGPAAPETDFNSVDISYSDETTSYTASACYTFERTWTITVTDASGNATTVTDVQTIQVADTSAPDITALANTTAAWDLFSFDLSAGDQSTVLAYTSFEEGTSGDQYVDTGDAAADHALVNNPGQSDVNFTSTGGEMGFTSYYYSTGSNGLTDGDFVGVTSFTGAVGAYTDGSQGFQMQDTDGIMEVVFDNVDVSMGGVTLTLDYFPQSTGWETADRIRIWVVADGGEVDLVDTDYQDIDGLGIEGQWNLATLDLDGFDDAELHISLESNSGSEGLFIDNIAFSAGNSPLAALEANGYVSFSDNVELASTEAAITLDGNTCDGAYDIVYTATDSCGNTTTMAQHIDLEDAVNPAISDMPANITQTNDAGNCSAAVSWTAPTSSDNCSVDTFTSDYSSGDDFPVGTTTVTYTAADASGNTTTSTFTVTVTDDEAPVISGMPSNITQSSDAGLCTAVVNWTAPTAADNCGIASFTSDADSGDAFGIGENTVTYTATDIHGNTTTASFTITVEENEDPTIAGMPGDINQTNDPGVCGAVVTWTAPTAADNCGIASFTPSHAIGSTFDVGTTTVTYTATDLAGNTATATFDVTITFDDNPAIAGMPSDLTQTADAGECGAVITWVAPTVPANCGDATLTSTHNSGDTFAVGATTVSYTAEDIHGNTTTSTFTVTVTDDEDPVISGMPSDITQTADAGECEADVTWTAPTASDNCAIATFTSDANAGDAFAVGSTTVTYTATDIHGNSSTGSFTITVTDDEDPVISGMPADITQSNDAGDCSAAVSWTAPTASDNCGVASLTTSHAIGSVFAVGNTTVTYTATDVNGNTSTASFTVTITDDEDPVIAGVPADMTLSNDAGDCSAEANWTAPTATDNCGIASFTSTHDSGDAFAVGTTTVYFTASDVNGNTTTETFTVTVTDDEDPTISGTPANITLNNDAGDCSAVASWTDPTAADNCAIATFTSTHNSGDAFAVGTTTVTYTATDIHSNTTTSTFTVTVTDNEQPVISGLPSDITQTADAGECEADVTWTAPTATDNCAIATFTSTANPGDAFPEGMTTVTYTATDIHGNSSTGSFTITVTDDEDPAISGTPANITQSNDAGNCSAAVSWTAPTASDNCGVASLTATHAIGSVFAVGTTTVTYTATDINGNTSTSSFTVTVTDDENPVISPLAEDHTYQRDGGEAAAFAAWLGNYGGAAATDNCDISGWSNNSTGLSDDCGSTGTETVTFTVTDIHGNSSTTQATFTVIDNVAPSCPLIDLFSEDSGMDATDNITNDTTPTMRVMFTGSGTESAESGDVVELYIDGSLIEAYTIDQTDVDNGYAEFETGPFTDGPVQFSALHIDDCGQSSIFAFLNAIVHTTDPIASAQDITLHLDGAGNATLSTGDVDTGSSDDFNALELALSQTDFDCSHEGSNSVTFTATDIAGNSASQTITVLVLDEVLPTVLIQDHTLVLDASGAATLMVDDLDAGSSDACGIATRTLSQTAFDCSHVGDQEVTLTVTDNNGNVASATATVTVQDNTAPIVAVQNITVELDANGEASITVADIDAGSADACGIASMTIDVMSFDCSDLGTASPREVTLTVTDMNGNVASDMALVTVEDNESPEVNIFDLEDYTLYAGDGCVNIADLFGAGSPWYEATDNCGADVEIVYDEINETGIAGCREFDRRWIIIAEDASGNTASDTTIQHITVIDATAPVVFLDGVPADLSIDLDADCNGEMPAASAVTASATDNCTDAPTVGVVSFVDSDPAYLCGDAGSYTIVRTYMASATDDCGNSGMATATQTVTFNDITAPQITDSEGIANGETLTQEEATGLFDFIFIPGPADLEAQDACSDVSIEVTEVLGGFIPTETADNFCGAATPEAFNGADACNGGAPAAIVLEGMPFNGAAFTIVPGGVNIVESRFDQTISIEVEVENADGTGGFIWNADYNAAIDWTTWSGLGRGYKKDCAEVLPGDTVWTGWEYFIMQTGGMLGTGIYAGSELSLTHQPMNYFYGLQVGLGANNQNANYGASAWFYWSGELVVNGASQGMLGSSGDIMLDLDCVMPWTASYDYTVTDACGNETTFGYSMTNAAMSAPVDAGVSGEGAGHHPFDVSVGSDLKEPIRVTGLQPNPTNDISQLGFVVSTNMRLRIDLYDMAGQLVQELFDGNAMNNVEYFMAVDAQGLDAGMYQIRLTSDEYMAVKKLLVTQ